MNSIHRTDDAEPSTEVTATPLEREIAQLLVSVLSLDLNPVDIAPTTKLYGSGLGLDSIDLLEVAMEITGRYGFTLKSGDPDNRNIFDTTRSLAAHVATHRTR